jgi:hypothetical protein
MGVDNAIIEVDGPEVPIMDGSAAAFVAAIDQAGIVTQSASRRFIQVLKPVQVAIGDSFGELRPHGNGFRVEVEIAFDNIGAQPHHLIASPIKGDATAEEVEKAFKEEKGPPPLEEKGTLSTAVLEGGELLVARFGGGHVVDGSPVVTGDPHRGLARRPPAVSCGPAMGTSPGSAATIPTGVLTQPVRARHTN